MGGAARWVCYTTSTYAITLSMSRLGQVLGTYRAAKQKKSNFSLLSNPRKSQFYKLQKFTDLSSAKRSGAPIKATGI